MPPIPFLKSEEKLTFLQAHRMIEDDFIDENEFAWLESINFHYMLGYAGNYRALVDKKLIQGPKRLSQIRSIIDSEIKLSTFMMPWLRKAELNLRALTIKHFCEKQAHGEGYLKLSNWQSNTDGDRERLRSRILDSIHRHSEPYVEKHIKSRAREIGLKEPPRYSHDTHEDSLKLTDGLPLWAVIDSFSIGTLGKFIMLCGKQPAGEELVWKLIAQELGITARYFDTVVDSFAITRNLIFHHQRLWMRPIPKNPGIPTSIEKRYRGYRFKKENSAAHFIALINLSRFIKTKDEQDQYLDSLEELVKDNELYSRGIMKSPFSTR